MTKRFKLQDLECANCAAKMEEQIGKLPQVTRVSVSFMQQSMQLEAEDAAFGEALAAAKRIIRRIEPDVEVVAR